MLSLVPGIWEDPSIRELLAGGRERRGDPSWPPGSDLTCRMVKWKFNSLFGYVFNMSC